MNKPRKSIFKFKGEIRNKSHSLLLLAFGSPENGKNRNIESVLNEVGSTVFTRCTRKTEKNRDRVEIRTAYTTSDIAWLYGKEKWKNLSCIGAIKTEFEKSGRRSEGMAPLYLQSQTHGRGTTFVMPEWSGQ